MKLDDLAVNTPAETNFARQGGVCVIERDHMTIEAVEYYQKEIRELQKHAFWKASDTQKQYRPVGGLWAPQRRAVATCVAYLGACSAGLASESALVKMPTGTGKTAVIATLACALTQVRRVLIVTPQRALVDQLIDDVHWRFWQNFGLIYSRGTFIGLTPEVATGVTAKSVKAARSSKTTTSTVLAASETPSPPTGGPGVVRLLPSTAIKIASISSDERLVVVSTFKALEQVVRPARPAHRLVGARGANAELPPDRSSEGPIEEALASQLLPVLKDFDLVIVDEGHYEPAFVWSQCIRELNRPTVLFSATPYRNDFKYFAVRGRFAFNLSLEEAVGRALIRPVQFAEAKWLPADDRPKEFAQAALKFYDSVVRRYPWPDPGKAPRVVVRAHDFESLRALQAGFAAARQRTVLIHDNIKKEDPAALEFNSASAALRSPATRGITFWLHQWKLLEGVDEKAFACVAIYQGFSNSRAAIQQIGRILRFLDHSKSPGETACIFASETVLTDIEQRFRRYERFERYFDCNPKRALMQEARLPSVMLKDAPEYQYLFGDFCERLGLDDDAPAPSFDDFKLPFRATVLRRREKTDLDELARRCQVAMGLEDRYDMRIITPRQDDPTNARLIVYLTWQNSEILVRHSFPIWNLGVMAIVEVGNRIFLFDTDGLVIDVDRLGLETEAPEALRRLVPADAGQMHWRVGQTSAVGLDLTDGAVRSATARMHDFSTGFYDLAQNSQALTALRAHGRNARRAVSRYLSLERSTISDTLGQVRAKTHGISAYVKWTEAVAMALDDTGGADSAVFDRFAKSVPAPSPDDAVPLNILFDLQEVLDNESPEAWNNTKVAALLEAELSVDVDENGEFMLRVGEEMLEGTIKYEITGTVHRRGRYVINSPQMDAFVAEAGGDQPTSLSRAVTRRQAFRIVPAAVGLTYARRTFYRAGIDFAAIKEGKETGTPLEALRPSAWMANVISEKGRGAMSEWVSGSIFGGMYARYGFARHGRRSPSNRVFPIALHDPKLEKELEEFDIVVCDDGSNEMVDFFLVSNSTRRVVFVHAKVNDSKMSLNAMQVVGRQAQAGLPFMLKHTVIDSREAWWATAWSTDDNRQISNRTLRSSASPGEATWQAIDAALKSAAYSKEVWIWAGKSLSKSALIDKLSGDRPTAHGLQMLYYLAALQTSVARANIGLRIYCSD